MSEVAPENGASEVLKILKLSEVQSHYRHEKKKTTFDERIKGSGGHGRSPWRENDLRACQGI